MPQGTCPNIMPIDSGPYNKSMDISGPTSALLSTIRLKLHTLILNIGSSIYIWHCRQLAGDIGDKGGVPGHSPENHA